MIECRNFDLVASCEVPLKVNDLDICFAFEFLQYLLLFHKDDGNWPLLLQQLRSQLPQMRLTQIHHLSIIHFTETLQLLGQIIVSNWRFTHRQHKLSRVVLRFRRDAALRGEGERRV